MRDHSGQCPVQYLENIGLATEQSDWLILVIGPLNKLSRVIKAHIPWPISISKVRNCHIPWLAFHKP